MNDTEVRIKKLLIRVMETSINYQDITTPFEQEMLNSWHDLLVLLPIVIKIAGKVPSNIPDRLDIIEERLNDLNSVLLNL